MSWSHQELQNRLRDIMTGIHQEYVEHGSEKGYVDYMKGVNMPASPNLPMLCSPTGSHSQRRTVIYSGLKNGHPYCRSYQTHNQR